MTVFTVPFWFSIFVFAMTQNNNDSLKFLQVISPLYETPHFHHFCLSFVLALVRKYRVKQKKALVSFDAGAADKQWDSGDLCDDLYLISLLKNQGVSHSLHPVNSHERACCWEMWPQILLDWAFVGECVCLLRGL